jgi:methyl-accepting chemotaxis protein
MTILNYGLLNINEQNKKDYIKEAYSQKEIYLQNNVQLVMSIIKQYHKKSNSANESEMKKEALKAIENLRYGKSGYFWINDMKQVMIMHPIKPSLNGKDLTNFKDPAGVFLFQEMTKVCGSNGNGIVKYKWPKPGHEKPVDKYSYVELFGPWGWVVGTGDYVTDVESKIIKHNKETEKLITDEFIFTSIVSFILIVISLIIILKVIDMVVNKPLKDAVNAISESTNTISTSSSVLSNGATQLSNMSANQSASVEEITATIEETSTNVHNNFKNMEELTQYDLNMETKANHGYEYMVKLKKSMEDIAQSSKEINSLVNTIDEIAFQTNLLALNAAVEAARAGEHGVGFAVVAEEVRNLATRSANEAVKIHDVIEQSVSQADSGLDIATKTNTSFQEILDNIKSSMIIREQATNSSKEQKVAIEQLKTAILEVDRVTQQLSLSSQDISDMAKNLHRQTQSSNEVVANISSVI